MGATPSVILHGVVPGHGPWSAIGDVAVFLAFLLTILGVVVLFEGSASGAQRWKWVALIVLLPVVGPVYYLARRRQGKAP